MKKYLLPTLGVLMFAHLSCAPAEDPVAAPVVPTPVFTTGMSASIVMGQASFTTSGTGITAAAMHGPSGVSVTAGGAVYVAESNNGRVIGFNATPTANGASADVVLGLSSFTVGGGGTGADECANPRGVFASGTQVFVADWGNHRVNIYNTLTTGAAMTYAVGQTATNLAADPGGGVGPATMRYPQDVFVSGTKMVVADGNFNRVLLYTAVPAASNASAVVALGQADLTNGASGVSKMSSPVAVWTNGTKIVVADMNNHRVLIWNSWPATSGVAPDIILGQSDLTTNTGNNGGISASSLQSPQGVTSNGTELFVSDASNNRILVWNTWPTANKQAADKVLGQPDFATATTGTTAATLSLPRGLSINGSNLFVADAGNNRVLLFKKQ